MGNIEFIILSNVTMRDTLRSESRFVNKEYLRENRDAIIIKKSAIRRFQWLFQKNM